MKPLHAWLALVVMLAVHGTAHADFIATATLTGDGESNSPGRGVGTVTLNAAADTLTVSLSFQDLTSDTTIPKGDLGAAGIRLGDPGMEGPAIFPFADFPTGVTMGTFSKVLTPADLMSDSAAGIITFLDAVNAIEGGHTYYDIHTVAFPAGEIRGQITVVPEPAALPLLALGLGGVLVHA
jgi:CHRD domain